MVAVAAAAPPPPPFCDRWILSISGIGERKYFDKDLPECHFSTRNSSRTAPGVSSEKPVTNHLGCEVAHKNDTSNLLTIYLLDKALSKIQVQVIDSAILNDKTSDNGITKKCNAGPVDLYACAVKCGTVNRLTKET